LFLGSLFHFSSHFIVVSILSIIAWLQHHVSSSFCIVVFLHDIFYHFNVFLLHLLMVYCIIITMYHVIIFTLLHHLSSIHSILYYSHSVSHTNVLSYLMLVTFSSLLFYVIVLSRKSINIALCFNLKNY